MRRALAGAAAAGLGLVLALAPASQAQESIPPAYQGSRITTPASVGTPAPALTAHIVRSFNGNLQKLIVETFITTPGGLPSGCGPAGELKLTTTVGPSGEPNTAASSATASTPCNGTYGIRVVATLKNNLGGSTVDKATLIGQVNVVAPPSAVSDVDASFDGSAVNITWASYSGGHKDFVGYRVQRQSGDEWTTLGNVGPNATSYSDGGPPAEGGRITYRVLARRSGPGEDITCGCGGKTTIELPTSTTSSTVPGQTDGGTTGGADGGTGGADGGTGGDGGTTGDGSTPTTAGSGKAPKKGGGRSFSALPRGQVGVGTKAPRLGTPTGANIPGLLTPDSGFDEELDYGDRELGSGDSEDGLSSFYYDPAGGRGMAVPVATGFVFLGWAVFFRYLARAAKPATAAGPRGGKGRRARGTRTGGARSTGARSAAHGPARGQRSAPATKRGWAYR